MYLFYIPYKKRSASCRIIKIVKSLCQIHVFRQNGLPIFYVLKIQIKKIQEQKFVILMKNSDYGKDVEHHFNYLDIALTWWSYLSFWRWNNGFITGNVSRPCNFGSQKCEMAATTEWADLNKFFSLCGYIISQVYVNIFETPDDIKHNISY